MNDLLPIALDAVVRLRIAELRNMNPGLRDDTRATWAMDAVVVLAYVNDVRDAETFNNLGRALAALAFQPGGVTFAGQHWEANGG